MNRRQQYLSNALRDVDGITDQPKAVQKIYGGLCHKLPVLLRVNGLCQTVAFIEDKAKGGDGAGERATAYRLLRDHMQKTLAVSDLARHAAGADVARYMRDTRTLLEAWAYYKRFAVSILDVLPGEGDER